MVVTRKLGNGCSPRLSVEMKIAMNGNSTFLNGNLTNMYQRPYN